MEIECLKFDALGSGATPVNEEPIHSSVGKVPVIAALLIEAVGTVVASEDRIVNIVVLQGLVISAVQHDWELVLDVEVSRVLEEEESAGAEGLQLDCAVDFLVILHVSWFENVIASAALRKRDRITLGMIVVPVEIRAVLLLITVRSVASIASKVVQVWIVGAVLVTVSNTGEAKVVQLSFFSRLYA